MKSNRWFKMLCFGLSDHLQKRVKTKLSSQIQKSYGIFVNIVMLIQKADF